MFRSGFFIREGMSPIQFLILLQLRKQPMYGYEILKALREQFADIWEPKTGTIYPALRRLETRGFVQTKLKEDKEFYSLTEKGKEILKDAGVLLEESLEFAEKYYKSLTPLHRHRIMDKIVRRLSHGHLPILLPFHPNNFEDKEIQIGHLKIIREATQKWLQDIDERIKKLGREDSGESKPGGT